VWQVLAVVAACGTGLHGQERQVPKDSVRVSVSGCVKGRMLTAMARATPEPVGPAIETGRHFRLSGPKKLIDEIRAQERHLVEVTGLVRKSQLSPVTGGIPIGGGGRIRIGGGPVNRDPTQIDPARDPLANQTILDVESWKPLPDTCPVRDE
jgi:hypothetical protein